MHECKCMSERMNANDRTNDVSVRLWRGDVRGIEAVVEADKMKLVGAVATHYHFDHTARGSVHSRPHHSRLCTTGGDSMMKHSDE